MIFPIEHITNWKFMCQNYQTPNEKNNRYRDKTKIDHKYKVGDQTMIRNISAFKYETPYNILYKDPNMG